MIWWFVLKTEARLRRLALVCRIRGHVGRRWHLDLPYGYYACDRCEAVLETYRYVIRSNLVSENGWERVPEEEAKA